MNLTTKLKIAALLPLLVAGAGLVPFLSILIVAVVAADVLMRTGLISEVRWAVAAGIPAAYAIVVLMAFIKLSLKPKA